MAAGMLAITGITINILYRAALREQRSRLMETVFSQSRMISAIFQFASTYYLKYPEGAEAATLNQVRAAYKNFNGFGESGEFTLANREGNEVHFLLHLRHATDGKTNTILINSKLAEPMQRALAGESGTMIGNDYRGELVLAAFEPLKDIRGGLVAKLDMREIRHAIPDCRNHCNGFCGNHCFEYLTAFSSRQQSDHSGPGDTNIEIIYCKRKINAGSKRKEEYGGSFKMAAFSELCLVRALYSPGDTAIVDCYNF